MKKTDEVKIQFTISRELAEKINEVAKEKYYSTRTGYIRQVLVEALKKSQQKNISDKE